MEMKMSESSQERMVQCVSIRPAENGAIVNYMVKSKQGQGTYDNYSWKDKTEVFEAKDKMTKDDAIEAAFERFEELWRQEYGLMPESESEGSGDD